jgi:hypothetical protein
MEGRAQTNKKMIARWELNQILAFQISQGNDPQQLPVLPSLPYLRRKAWKERVC